MRLLVFLAIFALIAVVVYFAIMAVRAAAAKHKAKGPKEWTLCMEETPDSTEFWLVKGDNADFIGRALRKDADYSMRYMEIESEAEEKAFERNAANRITRNLNK